MGRRSNNTLSSWQGGCRAAGALGVIALALWLAFPRTEVTAEGDPASDDAPADVYEIREKSWTVEEVATEEATPWQPYEDRIREELGAEARERWNNLDIALKEVKVIDVR